MFIRIFLQDRDDPMFQLAFEGALFKFVAKAPTIKPLLQLLPT